LAGKSLLGIGVTEVRASALRIARVERIIIGPGSGRPNEISVSIGKGLPAEGSHPASWRTPPLCLASYPALSVIVGCRSVVISCCVEFLFGCCAVVTCGGVIRRVLLARKRERGRGGTILPATEHRVGACARSPVGAFGQILYCIASEPYGARSLHTPFGFSSFYLRPVCYNE